MASGQRRGRWSGVPLQDRQALRRDELIAAGVALLGRPEGPHLTVRAVCKAAGLTERYFYESFTDRDEYVAAVYDDVCTAAMTALMKSESMRDAVERFVALMIDDPARGRVLLLAPEAEPVLARSGARWMPNFIELLQRSLTQHQRPDRPGDGCDGPDRGTHCTVHGLSGRPTGREQGAIHRPLC